MSDVLARRDEPKRKEPRALLPEGQSIADILETGDLTSASGLTSRSVFGQTEIGRAFVLLRKKSLKGLGGHVYFLEKQTHKTAVAKSGVYGLYGGTIELNPKMDKSDEYEGAKVALLRELEEEIDVKELGDTPLNNVLSGFAYREGKSMFEVHVFVAEEHATDGIRKKDILDFQRSARTKDRELAREIAELKADTRQDHSAEIEKKENERLDLVPRLTAGRPVKVRYWLGRWWMFSQLFAELPWEDLTPLAAYSLLANRRYEKAIRFRPKRKKKS